MSITFVCDVCGKRVENARWGRPEGWLGEMLGSNWPSDYVPQHHCDECNNAVRVAQEAVLEERRRLRDR